jgi:hypothetical protein
MANILGQLVVNLLANTAGFEQGLSKATKQAKAAGKELESAFNDIGDVAEKLLSPFGELGRLASSAFSGIGSSAKGLLEVLGPIGGAAVAAGLAIAGVAAVSLAAGVGAIGLAVHASEAAAHLGELSKSTGISVESLSLLGSVAESKGISVDSMAKALEKMEKSAVAAAQAGPKASNAYTELGVAVKNADGSMRSAEDIFNDVSKKFAEMPDGPLKTAEAMKVFGRAGADIIPLLDEGGAKLQELEGHYQALGAVVTGPMAAASEQLKENTSLLGAAFSGVENQLVSDLVPAINVAAQQFVSFFEQNHTAIVEFIDGVADISKVVINIGQVIAEAFSLAYNVVSAIIESIELGAITVGRTVGELAKGNFKAAWEEVKSGSSAAWTEAKNNATSAIDGIKSSIEGIKGVWTASLPSAEKTPTGAGPKVGAPVDLSFLDAAVTKYQSEEKAAEQAAAGIGKATEATILATAEAKAQKDIDTLVAEAQKKKIDGTAAFADALEKAIPKIEQAAQFTAAFNAASEDSKGLEGFISKTNEQTQAYDNQVNALGAVAREQAAYTAKLSPYLVQIAELEKVQKDLSALYGENDTRVLSLSARIDTLKSEYQQATVAVNAHNSALQSSKIQEALDSENSQLSALQKTTSALESGGEAYAKIDQQVQKFALDTNASIEAQDRYRAVLVAINAEQQKQAALNLASPGSSQQAANLQLQITALEQIRTEWQGLGKDTTGVDQALRTINADYQDLQAKTGGFTQGATAAFADFAKNVQSDGQIMQSVITQGLNGISQNLSTLIATGKAKWQDLITSMETALLKSSINTILNSLFKNLGGALSGQGGILGSLGGILGGGQNAAGTAALTTAGTTLTTAGTLLNTGATQLIAAATTLQTSSLGGVSGGDGGGLSDLFDSFGGGFADGGDVTPGRSYLVGERGPELFSPGRSGSITPNNALGGGRSQTINQSINITTPNADSFARSQAQIGAQTARDAQMAHARFRT